MMKGCMKRTFTEVVVCEAILLSDRSQTSYLSELPLESYTNTTGKYSCCLLSLNPILFDFKCSCLVISPVEREPQRADFRLVLEKRGTGGAKMYIEPPNLTKTGPSARRRTSSSLERRQRHQSY